MRSVGACVPGASQAFVSRPSVRLTVRGQNEARSTTCATAAGSSSDCAVTLAADEALVLVATPVKADANGK